MNFTDKERERADKLHRKCIVIDAHSDIPIHVVIATTRGEKNVLQSSHIPKLIAGGVTGGPATVWGDSGSVSFFGGTDLPTTMALRSIGMMKREIDESKTVVLARTASEIREAKTEGKIAFFLHLEGGKPIGDCVDYVRVFYELGVTSVGLTWNVRNLISDGIAERSNSGLSDFGVQVVEEMNRLGMIIDTSHLSVRGFWDVLQFSKDPVVASHSNCQSICDDPRNLTDEQIKALAEKGGVVGVNFYSGFIHKKEPSLEKLLDHIDLIVNLVGSSHVGLGADFMDYMGDYMKEYAAKYKLSFIGPHPKGIENTSKLQNVTVGLVSRGYSDQEIEKILGLNFLRVYERVLGA